MSVDVDLLADYVGGALSSTDESRVAELVATDPEWAEAHTALVAALDATAAGLRAYAATTAEPMPGDVSERLLAAITAEAGAVSGDAESTAGGADDQRPADDPRRVGSPARAGQRPADDARDTSGPGRGGRGAVPEEKARPARTRRKRRWATWAAPVAVAAAVAAFAGVWINQSADVKTTTASDSAGSANNEAAQAPAAGQAQPVLIPQYATGRDYTARALAGGFPGTERSAATASSPGTLSAPENATGAPVAPELARLRDPAALASCVDAIATARGQGPITVEAADFATYQERPAVIVFFVDATGGRWAWVAGPACGPAGADELFSGRVG